MRKTLVILLISLHLFSNTELNQLFKLPELVTHYQKTRNVDPSVNFFDFLVMHYSGDDGNPMDDKEDKGLPFMGYHHCVTVAIAPQHDLQLPHLLQPYSNKDFGSYELIFESRGFSPSLLRPPCFV